MNTKIPRLPKMSRAIQAARIGRDLLGASALGATIAMLLFLGWLIVQFGHAPGITQLANSGTTLTWIIAGVYGALWLVRAVHPSAENAQSRQSRKLDLSPLVQASGNGALIVLFACSIGNVTPNLVNDAWVIVVGYPLATFSGLLFAVWTGGRTA
jgi:hypothetical protein